MIGSSECAAGNADACRAYKSSPAGTYDDTEDFGRDCRSFGTEDARRERRKVVLTVIQRHKA